MQQNPLRLEEPHDLQEHLARIDWAHGLTRNDIKAAYPAFPQALFLRLPDSKRFNSPEEVLHAARTAPSRAEGDFMGAEPDFPSKRSVEEGGPPDWGDSPLVTPGGVIDSGSEEDRGESAP
ncbi:MAG TPA: hypothetical protein VH540_12675 [Ktedonobacterales bacterium]